MVWQKALAIIILFYFVVLLQNSFFVHFSFFGAAPNLVLILFFLFLFFTKQRDGYYILFLSGVAGILLDIFSSAYLGLSIASLIIIGYVLKNIQLMLKNRKERYPFVYFLPLFVIFLLAYDFLMSLYLYFFNKVTIIVNIQMLYTIIYSSVIASVLFYLYKKLYRYDT